METISEDDYNYILQSADGAYEIETDKTSYLKRCKGAKCFKIEKELRHQDFREAVLEKKKKWVDFYSINSKTHRVSTFYQKRLALSGFYDKRFRI